MQSFCASIAEKTCALSICDRLDTALERVSPAQSSGIAMMSQQEQEHEQEHECSLAPHTQTCSANSTNVNVNVASSLASSSAQQSTRNASALPQSWLAQRTRNAALYNTLREVNHCRQQLRVCTYYTPVKLFSIYAYTFLMRVYFSFFSPAKHFSPEKLIRFSSNLGIIILIRHYIRVI